MMLEVMYVHLRPLATHILPSGCIIPRIGEQVVISGEYYNVKNLVWEVTTKLYSVAIHVSPI